MNRIGEYQQSATVSDDQCTYSVNECYQLQTNAPNRTDDGGARYAGGVEVKDSSNMKGASQKGMKRCVIVLTFAVVLLALVTIAALALAVISYSHLSGELTDKINFFSSQLNQVRNKTELTDSLVKRLDS